MKRHVSLAGLLVAATVARCPALTFVIDMKSASQPVTTDRVGNQVGGFDYAGFGFAAAQQATLDASILESVRDDYYGIPTQATMPASPIPAGFRLDVDFVLGDVGVRPSNGDPEYYYAQVGTAVRSPGATTLGVSGTASVRTAAGAQGYYTSRAVACSIFSDHINALSNLTPADALTSGDLTSTTYAIAGTLAHEIGHTLSLYHVNKAGSVQPDGLPPIMGTGAIDLPNQDRLGPREFTLSGYDSESGSPQFQIAQLVGAVGLRAVPEPSMAAALALLAAGLRRRACGPAVRRGIIAPWEAPSRWPTSAPPAAPAGGSPCSRATTTPPPGYWKRAASTSCSSATPPRA